MIFHEMKCKYDQRSIKIMNFYNVFLTSEAIVNPFKKYIIIRD